MQQRRSRRVLAGVCFALLGGLLFAVLPAMAASLAAPQQDSDGRFGGVYRRPLADDPSSLDPARTSDVYANTVVNQLFDGLVQFDQQFNPIPAIAGFWEASLNGLIWTFHLRQGVQFHHGREVTAADFVYSFTRILDPTVQSPVANLFMHIQGAKAFRTGAAPQVAGLRALDRHILQITLTEPYAPFLSILAMVNAKVVPREAVEERGEPFGLRPIGSGPFTFESWERNKQIVIQANQQYYTGRPFLDQVVFKIGHSNMDTFTAFLNGKVEETIVPSTKAGEVRTDPKYRAYGHIRSPIQHLLYLGFNTRQKPFTNRKVRQAFNYAVNIEAIVHEIRQRRSIVAKGILPPVPGYDPELQGYYYNPRLAKQLLAEAGYPGGKGIPAIDLWFSSKEATTPLELEAYKGYLADIGVTLTIHRAANWPAFKKRLVEGQAAMFRLAWYADVPDPDNFFFPLLFSQSKTNRTFYHNPRVDRLLEQARSETDHLQRLQIYRDAEQTVLDDAPWISQHHKMFEYLYQPYVRGIAINSLGAHYIPMKHIWLHSRNQ